MQTMEAVKRRTADHFKCYNGIFSSSYEFVLFFMPRSLKTLFAMSCFMNAINTRTNTNDP